MSTHAGLPVSKQYINGQSVKKNPAKNIQQCQKRKEPFICELILERYIYLRNTQNQQKITNYVRSKNFLDFYLVYNGVCLKLLRSIL